MTEQYLPPEGRARLLDARAGIFRDPRHGAVGERTLPRWIRKPALLSPEIVEGVAKGLDFGLVLLTPLAAALISGTSAGDSIAHQVSAGAVGAMLFIVALDRLGGYRLDRLSMLAWQAHRVLAAWAVTSLLLGLALAQGWSSHAECAITESTGLVLLLVGRCIGCAVVGRLKKRGLLARNIAVVGAGEAGRRVIASLQKVAGGKIVIRGVFDDRKARLPPSIHGVEVVGTTDDLIRFARQVPIEEVILAVPLRDGQRLQRLLAKLKQLPADLRLSVEPVAEELAVAGIGCLGGVPLLKLGDRPMKAWSAVLKSAMDKLFAAILLCIMAPVMGVIAVLIKLESAGPVLFVQSRFGFNNNVIRVFKFRTMYADRGDVSGAQRTVHNDPRITRVGRVLRALSLDELPQLFNVLIGDMSLVGPRPHAVAMKAGDRLYHEAIAEYPHRHRVKPGITGWAQINGLRGEVDTLEKARARVEHDLYYIEHWSPLLDLKILVMTVPRLLWDANAY